MAQCMKIKIKYRKVIARSKIKWCDISSER